MMLTKLALTGLMAAMAAALAVASTGGEVSAQYPPPSGSCVIATSATSGAPNTSVGVTVTVLDLNGKPASGVPTRLIISRQPGSDASLSGSAGATDNAGLLKGSLGVGGASGVIGLNASTADVSCAATVAVGAGAVLSAVALPDTGDGSSAGDSPAVFAAFLLGAIGVVALGSTMTWRRARRG